jgi:chromosome segregation ATPase
MSEGGGFLGMGGDEDHLKKATSVGDTRKWHEELAKADERCARFRGQLDDLTKRKAEVEEKLTYCEKQILVRDDEIKRLHQLYQGGANLEVLSVKHTHETNEKTIGKLANQVEFLNKENH